MNSEQVYLILKSDPYVQATGFLGVFARDMIPITALKYPCGFVFNTDSSEQSGTHWLLILANENNEAYFFDSFGTPSYNNWEAATILDQRVKYSFNDRLQSNHSSLCGMTDYRAITAASAECTVFLS